MTVSVAFVLACEQAWAQPASPEVDAETAELAVVTLRDQPVFTLRRGEGGRDAHARARQVGRALAEVAAGHDRGDVRWERRGDRAVVLLGQTTLVSLVQDDALLANKPSLDALATEVTIAIDSALARERRRASLANTLFSASLVVFFGLLTLVLARRLHGFLVNARAFLETHPERIPALRLQALEVVGPATVRNGLVIVLSVGRRLAVAALGYAWLVASLSLFDRTRPLVEELTGFVLAPLSSLIQRIALSLPMFAVVLVAGAVVAILARGIELLLQSVARGEARLPWIDRDTAAPASVVLRASLILGAALFVGPVITGAPDGALSRSAWVTFVCLGLAATPLVTCMLSGLVVAFSRTLHVGDRVDYGGFTGSVREVGLLWVTLEDEQRALLRVPHLRALWHPTRVYPRERP